MRNAWLRVWKGGTEGIIGIGRWQGIERREHKFCVEGSQLLGLAGGEGGEQFRKVVRVLHACMVTAAAHEELAPLQLSQACS
jgi:hypothetical protein